MFTYNYTLINQIESIAESAINYGKQPANRESGRNVRASNLYLRKSYHFYILIINEKVLVLCEK